MVHDEGGHGIARRGIGQDYLHTHGLGLLPQEVGSGGLDSCRLKAPPAAPGEKSRQPVFAHAQALQVGLALLRAKVQREDYEVEPANR